MSAPTLTVGFGGRTTKVPFPDAHSTFQRQCATVFGLHPAEIVGLDNGTVIFPLSFLVHSGPTHFQADTVFHLILTRLPPPVVPSAVSHDDRSRAPIHSSKSSVMKLDLGDQTEVIDLGAGDLQNLVFLKSRTRLDNMQMEELHSVFSQGASVDGKLDKTSFDACIRKLVPGTDLSDRDKAFLSLALNKIFYAFDRDGDGVVDFDEFISGFLGLAFGTRTEKLLFAFKVFDQQNRGYISPIQLFKYMRAFLTVVLSLSSEVNQLPTEYVLRLIDDTAESVVNQCLAYSTATASGKITFEALQHWYETGGRKLMPWLDLLANGVDQALIRLSQEENHTAAKPTNDEEITSNAATADATEQQAIFEFVLSGDVKFPIYFADVEHLEMILEMTRLGDMEAETLHAAFSAEARNGVLNKSQFDNVMRQLIPGELISEEEQSFLSFTLSNIFLAYDRFNLGEVTLEEIASGFSLLSSGSKSHKLSLAFMQFDSDEDGMLSKLELAQYIRSFFIMLFALNESVSHWPSAQIYRLVDLTAVEATKSILKHIDATPDQGVRFEEFGMWYNQGGHEMVPWLELLDLRKWPTSEESKYAIQTPDSMARAAASAYNNNTHSGGDYDDDDVEEEEDDGSTDLIFQFQLTDDGKLLEIRPQDVSHLEVILLTSQLDAHSPNSLADKLQRGSVGGMITKSVFDRCVRELIPNVLLKDEVKRYLAYALSNIFYAYDREGNGKVAFRELVCGMCLLANGNKSEKLALGFHLFDVDGDGRLSKRELALYLRSFLTVLFAVNEDAAKKSAQQVWDMVDACAVEFTYKVFNHLNNDAGDGIVFEEFADWYTSEGYEFVPWLELLDLRKWPMTSYQQQRQSNPFEEDAAMAQQRRADDDDDDDESQPNVNDENDRSEGLVFQFQLTDPGEKLEIHTRDVEHLEMVLRTTNLANVPTSDFHQVFVKHAKADNIITKQSFDVCIRELVASDRLTPHDKAYLSYVLSNIFYAFDRESSDEVDVREFTSGFSLLSQGNKSEKLNLAFDLFDDDEDGFLSRMQLWLFIRSFLTVLLALNEDSANDPAEVIWKLVDEAAVEIAAKILIQTPKRTKADHINFEEFAAWYTEGGYDLIPWLELLDLKKWPINLAAGATDEDATPLRLGGDDLGDGSDLDNDEIVFQFILMPGEEDEHMTLELRPRDVTNLKLIVETTGFEFSSPETLQNVFEEASKDGMLAKAGFDRCVRELVPGDHLSKDQKTFLSYALSNLFYAYDRDGNGKVRTDQFTSGFTILSAGSKSDKLALTFNLFEQQEDGSVSKRELENYLASFLTVLFALNEEAASKPAEEVWSIVDLSVRNFVDIIYEETERDDSATISFEDFAEWYTMGGYELVPWLELLNLKKWPSGNEEEGSDTDQQRDEGEEEEEEKRQGDNDGDGAQDCDAGAEASSMEGVSLTESDVELVKGLTAVSKFGSMTIETMIRGLRECAPDDDAIDRPGFDAFVESTEADDEWSEEDRIRFRQCFEAIFKAYDRNESNTVSTREVVVGLAILLPTAQSEGVLCTMFQLFSKFDEDTEEEVITWKDLHQFVLSYYTMVSAVKYIQFHGDDSVEEIRQSRRALGVLALEAASDCFKAAGAPNNEGVVDFDAFEAWYNEEKHVWFPFLSLLSGGV